MKGTVPRYFSAVAIAAVLVVAGVQATSHPRFTVDDGSSATSTNYPTEVAFIGNNLTIDSSGFVLPTTTFNLTNVSGVAVTGEVNLTTANVTSEGRYLVRNESSNRTVAIDLVSNTSDITGRIKAQEDITKTDIELRYWLNNSRVDYSGNLINTTGPSVWNSTGEYIYRVNTTSIGKMWIGINSSQGGDFYVASSGDRQPRITDFPPVKPSGNVSGRIVNETGSGVANVTVRVSGVVSSPLLMIERLPYLDRPPIRTEMTNGTGHFNFTGLQSGLDYSVEVTNSSFRRTNHTPFGADISLSSGESVDAGEFQVTSTLGGINATVDAPVAEDVRYGMIAGNRDTGKGYMEPVNGTNNDYFFGNIPNGSYTVMMFRIDTRGGLLSTSFDTKIRSNVTVEKNRNTTLSFAFE
ncbi:MAG: carboxypeptidase-like regulatory domain-containing protein, partial [Candidatus Nanohaloarchaea archaeon]